MRVISGKARGKKLVAPAGMHTRPVTDQIKEALFSSWQFRINGARFLDCFAGSGSMGIEAISRNASYTVFIDNDNEANKIIHQNLKACHFDSNYKVLKEDVFQAFNYLDSKKESFDIIYMDPPYTVDEIFIPVMEAISKTNLLKNDGILAIRTKKEKEMPNRFNHLVKTKQKKYGISMVHFYELEEIKEVENKKN
ncbi:MAG: 16S rRNA (guanine(966)-N(2))-methyltransferase RsmD [Erysipelotrichaceae bacterium]|uniref:16S rRNA (guanine(966)-N(2))-methyltransferase RsmD n=1 Tax=Floccifex sp. TaxID=2815810 RepID=UPI002A7638AC|nr:16S rRNA (guanine(966)-N(2))-methyltransferase RsmD [Floccifex sp.]MDD7281119.1 16S rRNA (guanine(966)-N(2))-methyltransferase RsmD [Erysipelotrichaceae bacterium]MDY2957784.1 16S rRNA (guanine(966)-N(2))-methyltransferase RsmD [Floccifex sp.]